MFNEIIEQAEKAAYIDCDSIKLLKAKMLEYYNDAASILQLRKLMSKNSHQTPHFLKSAILNDIVLPSNVVHVLESALNQNAYEFQKMARQRLEHINMLLDNFTFNYKEFDFGLNEFMADILRGDFDKFPTFDALFSQVIFKMQGYKEVGKNKIAKMIHNASIDKEIPNSIIFKSLDCVNEWNGKFNLNQLYSFHSIKAFFAFAESGGECFALDISDKEKSSDFYMNFNTPKELGEIIKFKSNVVESAQFVLRGRRQKTLLITFKEPDMAKRLFSEIWGK